MRKIQIIIIALPLLLATIAPVPRASATKLRHAPAAYAPGEVIVKLKRAAPSLELSRTSGQFMSIARAMGNRSDQARAIEPLARPSNNSRVEEIISGRGLDRVFLLKLDPDADVDSIISALRANDEVEYAEPNYRIGLGTLTPNDPEFQNQWPLRNLGVAVEDYPSTPNADIKATEAWEITTGSPDVIVAVTDTGVDPTHPDLIESIYTNPGEIAGNNIDDDRNGYVDDVHGFNVADNNGNTSDIVGHGTQMSGIIAAGIDNGIGISGVSRSKILPVRFFRKTGALPEQYDATVADAARSLVYSIAAGAKIINASWRTLLVPEQAKPEESRALQEAVAATNDAGALLVCIAGNDGFNLDYSRIYPASYQLPNEIVVAASDFNDEIWHPPFYPYYINTGFGPNTVHLAAPGVAVLTTTPHGDCVLCSKSDNPADWYVRGDGTSISAAYVSGVAALVKSKYPNLSTAIIKRRIIEGAEIGFQLRDYVISSGRLNALGALTIPINTVPPVLDRVKYKQGSGKLFVYGKGIQQDVTVIVSGKTYSAKPKSDDLTAILARVPLSEFPEGVAVAIKLRNPDGGESQALFFTR